MEAFLANSIILAMDFGGTKHAAAIKRKGDRNWLRYRQIRSSNEADAADDIRKMSKLCEEVLAGETPGAVGVSFGGPVDYESGTILLSHHVPGWENTDLHQILEEKYRAPIAIDNDANAAALGEYHLGAGQGWKSLFYITISTGVGGGWIINGEPWRGRNSMAGEIGHASLDPDGPLCLCGKPGCLERFASGSYIAEDVRRILKESPSRGRILRRLAKGNPNRITAKLVAEAAALGDEVAEGRLHQSAWAIGTAIGNCANLINPDIFILGGGVTGAGDQFWPWIRTQARKVALPQIGIEIVPATLGDHAPLWGAVLLAEQMLP
jgi:glucokinase